MSDRLRPPDDQAQRDAAIDPSRSFIVQAPAGSGKTGLLTQRFLALLPTVAEPEEVIAITFTRKAAAEMRSRILGELARASEPDPEESFERRNRALARAALAHAEARDWGLLENPQRLRIRTIDSLCQDLARQMPLAAGLGDTPDIDEDATALYREAAAAVLAELESDSDLGAALATVLTALDNDVQGLHGLLTEMLGRREQWLEAISRENPRHEAEQALRLAVEDCLAGLGTLLEEAGGAGLAPLAAFAAERLAEEHPAAACRGLQALPGAAAADLPAWRGLAELALTRQDNWRKSVNKTIGFPADAEARPYKDAMLALLDRLDGDESLRAALAAVRKLPEPRYADDEWTLLQALFEVLRQAAGLFDVVVAERGRADFTAVALAANRALGEEFAPSDLALRLDYRIRHLLVDEFQDTSASQVALLKGLTRGWERGDGRSLFLVGDPMQSIYRFRKAEVGLFLEAWRGRLGSVELQPLRLQVNFRSRRGLVDWVNEHFPAVLPERGDVLLGAVPYAPAVAHQPAGAGPAVQVHACIGRDDEREAEEVLSLVRAARAEHPDGRTAVLVRSRGHLDHLVRRLRQEGLRYQAVEIGALAAQPAVLDALALTRALLHEADRVSWLAVLHGPLCGLGLDDLVGLVGDEADISETTVARQLAAPERLAALSADGRRRAEACGAVLRRVLDERGRQPLRAWVEGAWLALGGPATLPDDAAANDVGRYFDLLQALEEAPGLLTPERLREAVEGLYAEPDPRADASLQLMSIHKAKGLEFDTVILPGLGRGTRRDGRSLLYWAEVPGEKLEPSVLFGPVKPARAAGLPPTSEWIRRLQADMARHETGRLLYVAVTRARRRLHLLGHATERKDGELSVVGDSLLAQLWPVLSGAWERVAAAQPGQAGGVAETAPGWTAPPTRWRLPPDWRCPEPPAAAVRGEPAGESVETVIYDWAGDAARAVGTVSHRWLQRLVQAPVAVLAELPGFETATRRLLLQEGLPGARIGAAVKRVRRVLEATLADERGRWLLSPEHADSRCEWPLTARVDGELRRLVIDRSFVDADGVRWVIDYKTGTHEGGDPANFLEEEEARYRPQLERYAEAFRLLEDRPVRIALYYPLVPGGWREL